MAKKLKDANSTLKVFQVGEISGIISEEKYQRLLAINPAYADLFEDSSEEPAPLFVKAEERKETKASKPKSKTDDVQA